MDNHKGSGDAMTWINDFTPLLLRVFLVVLFPFSALDKILNWPSAMTQAGNMPFPRAMLAASIVVEFVAPACIVAGWHDRLAALVLAGFCVTTAVMFHQFWRCAEFWRFREGVGLQHFWEFLKNFGLAGGLGLLMLAPRTLPLSEVLHHPLTSTHVASPSTSNNRCPSGSCTP